MIAQLAGNMGDRRILNRDFCSSVLGFHINPGAIQKIIGRAVEAIGKEAKHTSVNYIEETSHRQENLPGLGRFPERIFQGAILRLGMDTTSLIVSRNPLLRNNCWLSQRFYFFNSYKILIQKEQYHEKAFLFNHY